MMLLLWMAFLACALTATGAAQSPATSGPPDSVKVLAGVFRAGTAHDIVIVPIRTPAGWILLLADQQTDQLRFLAPMGKGAYTAGSELTRPTPAEWTLRFTTEAKPTELTVEGNGTSLRFAARRIPIDAVSISFHNGPTRLEGFLYRPSGRGSRLPLIALAHGSEDNDRYSFGPIPWVLASQGYAVLVYDKRGTGASTGDWSSAGLEEYADDLVAGIRAMSRRPEIDAARIAVVGVSEGGWVAPLAASRSPDIKAIAAICGGARSKGDAYVHKMRRAAEADGRSKAQVDSVVRAAEELVASSVRDARAGASPSGFNRRLAYDPTQDWRRFRGPVLYMGGEADVLESGPDAALWFRRLFAEAGNVDVTIRLWPRAHHSLLLGVTGDPSEFRTLRGITQLAPGYWAVLLHWLEGQVRCLHPPGE
jgi:pimeloyl-ACP methyl ester carboxylesterase